jgi:para-nitrobenzyl esterase
MIARRTLLGAGLVMSGLAETMGPQAAAKTTAALGQQGDVTSVAKTASGRVRDATTDGIHTFKGIPYGASTARSGRFHPR